MTRLRTERAIGKPAPGQRWDRHSELFMPLPPNLLSKQSSGSIFEDTVEFFNLILETQLSAQEKTDLVGLPSGAVAARGPLSRGGPAPLPAGHQNSFRHDNFLTRFTAALTMP